MSFPPAAFSETHGQQPEPRPLTLGQLEELPPGVPVLLHAGSAQPLPEVPIWPIAVELPFPEADKLRPLLFRQLTAWLDGEGVVLGLLRQLGDLDTSLEIEAARVLVPEFIVPQLARSPSRVLAEYGQRMLLGLLDSATPIRGRDSTRVGTGLYWRTGTEVLAASAATPDWLIENLVPLAAITEMSSLVKVGKTTLTMQEAAAVAAGRPFLGRHTLKSPVVYLTEERPKSFAQAIRRAGFEDTGQLHVLLRHDARGLTWPQVAEAAVLKCKQVGAQLFVVDTIADWAGLQGDEENSAGAALQAMQPLTEAAASGLAVQLSRHLRKAGGQLGTGGRGSSAFSGAADVLYQLKATGTKGHPTRRLLEGVGRQDGIPDRLVLDLRDGRYVELGTCDDIELKDAMVAARELLTQASDVLLTPAIKEQLKARFSATTVKRALDDLHSKGEIDRLDGQGPNHRSVGWKAIR